jgi:hypothetical protein
MKDIELYSNPQEVLRKTRKYFGKNTELYLSTRKNKKYMILNPNTNKMVHFGQIGYEDFTKHKDKKRRDAFKKRNAKWANADKYTSAYMSFVLLW